MADPSIELIMAEFWSGDNAARLTPSLTTDSLRRYFPAANVKLMGDRESGRESPFDKDHPRYGWRSNDYFKVVGLLESTHDIAIAVDADMRFVSEEVRDIIPLTGRFGLCLPVNPRYLVRIDATIGADGDKAASSFESAYAVNMSPIAFSTANVSARGLLEEYVSEMEANPTRGPLAMWRAIWNTGFMPCLLPPQWCVCRENVGIGNEIVLHCGHHEVESYYADHWGFPKEVS